jgi:hypothetical protein
MCYDIEAAGKLGADGVVFGSLHPDGRVQLEHTRLLCSLAQSQVGLLLRQQLVGAATHWSVKDAAPTWLQCHCSTHVVAVSLQHPRGCSVIAAPTWLQCHCSTHVVAASLQHPRGCSVIAAPTWLQCHCSTHVVAVSLQQLTNRTMPMACMAPDRAAVGLKRGALTRGSDCRAWMSPSTELST